MDPKNMHEVSDDQLEQDPPDRTKWFWLAVLVVFGIMVAILWMQEPPPPSESVVRARHILIAFDNTNPTERAEALELVTSLRERLLSGESFARLAEEFSDDPHNAGRGGDLGYMPKGSYIGDFESYVWSGTIGELSPIIETVHGFHLVIIEDRQLSEIDAHRQRLRQSSE